MIYGPECVNKRTGSSLSDDADSEKRIMLFSVHMRLEAGAFTTGTEAEMSDDPGIGYGSTYDREEADSSASGPGAETLDDPRIGYEST
jgi:hypothetical protein